ncbi:hypothetical protein, partial [Mesorhizobium sp. M7A.F.Ca.CA.001.07.2.1]
VTLSTAALADAADGWRDGLYRPEPPATAETRLTAIPYFAWDNREPGEMLVWLRDG